MCCGNGQACGPQGVDALHSPWPEVDRRVLGLFGPPAAAAPDVDRTGGAESHGATNRVAFHLLRVEAPWQAGEFTGAVAAVRHAPVIPESALRGQLPFLSSPETQVFRPLPADDGLGGCKP